MCVKILRDSLLMDMNSAVSCCMMLEKFDCSKIAILNSVIEYPNRLKCCNITLSSVEQYQITSISIGSVLSLKSGATDPIFIELVLKAILFFVDNGSL